MCGSRAGDLAPSRRDPDVATRRTRFVRLSRRRWGTSQRLRRSRSGLVQQGDPGEYCSASSSCKRQLWGRGQNGREDLASPKHARAPSVASMMQLHMRHTRQHEGGRRVGGAHNKVQGRGKVYEGATSRALHRDPIGLHCTLAAQVGPAAGQSQRPAPLRAALLCVGFASVWTPHRGQRPATGHVRCTHVEATRPHRSVCSCRPGGTALLACGRWRGRRRRRGPSWTAAASSRRWARGSSRHWWWPLWTSTRGGRCQQGAFG